MIQLFWLIGRTLYLLAELWHSVARFSKIGETQRFGGCNWLAVNSFCVPGVRGTLAGQTGTARHRKFAKSFDQKN